jgi:hypothetical protein
MHFALGLVHIHSRNVQKSYFHIQNCPNEAKYLGSIIQLVKYCPLFMKHKRRVTAQHDSKSTLDMKVA